METTLCIIKPDAVKNGFEDKINEKIISSGLKIIKSKKTFLTEEIARDFYKEHASKPFFNELVEFIISGEVVVQVLVCLYPMFHMQNISINHDQLHLEPLLKESF